MGIHSFCRLALFGASVHALAFPGPRPTDNIDTIQQDGWTPKPTSAPEPHRVHEVLRRQTTALASTYLMAPDNVCGYFGGRSSSAYGCGEDYQCAILPPVGKVDGAAGCCVGSDCSFRVACVDKADMDLCDEKCQANANTVKCSGTRRFCNTVALGGINDYYCGTKRISTIQKAETTYKGQKGRTLSKLVVKPTTTSKPSSTRKTTSSSTSSSSSETESSSTTESSSSSETSSEPETSSTSADSSTTASVTETAGAGVGAGAKSGDPSTSDSPSTPVGAIVGGVIGGIALIALIILGAIFVRNQKKKNMEASAPGQHPMKENPFHSQQPPDPFAKPPPSSSFGAPQGASHLNGASAATAGAAGAAGAAAAAAVPAAGAYKSPSLSYRDPSPLSTPAASPGPQFEQPYPAPQPQYQQPPTVQQYQQPLPGQQYQQPPPGQQYQQPPPGQQYQQPPQQYQQPPPGQQYQQPYPGAPAPSFYQSYHQSTSSQPQDLPAPGYHSFHTPRQSMDQNHGPSEAWTGPSGGGAMAEPVDRRSTSTPLSTYNGIAPTTPASALNSMPGEQSMGASAPSVPPVPLVLQPGMGYRPYRPPSNSVSSTTPPTVRSVTSPPPAVAEEGPSQGHAELSGQSAVPPPPQQQQQQQQQSTVAPPPQVAVAQQVSVAPQVAVAQQAVVIQQGKVVQQNVASAPQQRAQHNSSPPVELP